MILQDLIGARPGGWLGPILPPFRVQDQGRHQEQGRHQDQRQHHQDQGQPQQDQGHHEHDHVKNSIKTRSVISQYCAVKEWQL